MAVCFARCRDAAADLQWYRVAFHTSIIEGAGTDARISLQLHGSEGERPFPQYTGPDSYQVHSMQDECMISPRAGKCCNVELNISDRH